MGMFDYFHPVGVTQCPIDGHALNEWQGKDGPCALFLWEQGQRHPVDQPIDQECRLSPEQWRQFTLPERFVIYSYDCPDHPIIARCTTEEGVWTATSIDWDASERTRRALDEMRYRARNANTTERRSR